MFHQTRTCSNGERPFTKSRNKEASFSEERSFSASHPERWMMTQADVIAYNKRASYEGPVLKWLDKYNMDKVIFIDKPLCLDFAN